MTRRQLIGEEEFYSQLPEPGPLTALLEALINVGMTDFQVGFDGPVFHAISWTEFSHWPGVSDLLPCEVQALRDLSFAYAQMRNSGADAPEPV